MWLAQNVAQNHEGPTRRAALTPQLGMMLRRARLGLGLTQRQVAEAVGTSRATVSRLEGEAPTRAPSVATAVALARVLRLSEADRGRLMGQARLAGRSSPFVTGDWQ